MRKKLAQLPSLLHEKLSNIHLICYTGYNSNHGCCCLIPYLGMECPRKLKAGQLTMMGESRDIPHVWLFGFYKISPDLPLMVVTTFQSFSTHYLI